MLLSALTPLGRAPESYQAISSWSQRALAQVCGETSCNWRESCRPALEALLYKDVWDGQTDKPSSQNLQGAMERRPRPCGHSGLLYAALGSPDCLRNAAHGYPCYSYLGYESHGRQGNPYLSGLIHIRGEALFSYEMRRLTRPALGG